MQDHPATKAAWPHLRTLLSLGFAALCVLTALWVAWPIRFDAALVPLITPTVTPSRTQHQITMQATPTAFVPTATIRPLIHVVVPGEVLGLIAAEYGTTVDALIEANNLDKDGLIGIGQELLIVGAQRTPVSSAAESPTPTGTPTSSFRHAVPIQIRPATDEVVGSDGEGIALQWTSVAVLAANEWYQIRVWSDSGEMLRREWTKGSSWIWEGPLAADRTGSRLCWDVTVVRREDDGVIALSPRSTTRCFRIR